MSESALSSRDLCNAYNNVVNAVSPVSSDESVQTTLRRAVSVLEELGRKCEIATHTRRIEQANATIRAAVDRIAEITNGEGTDG